MIFMDHLYSNKKTNSMQVGMDKETIGQKFNCMDRQKDRQLEKPFLELLV